MLTLIVLELPPHVAFTNNEANIQFQIFQHCLAPFQSDIYTSETSLANNPFKSGAAWWSAQSETSLATNPFKSGDAWWSVLSETSLANNQFKSGAVWWSALSDTSLAKNQFKSGAAWWSAPSETSLLLLVSRQNQSTEIVTGQDIMIDSTNETEGSSIDW